MENFWEQDCNEGKMTDPGWNWRIEFLFLSIEDTKTKLDILPSYRLQRSDSIILAGNFATQDLEIEIITTSKQKAIKPMAGRPMGGITSGI